MKSKRNLRNWSIAVGVLILVALFVLLMEFRQYSLYSAH